MILLFSLKYVVFLRAMIFLYLSFQSHNAALIREPIKTPDSHAAPTNKKFANDVVPAMMPVSIALNDAPPNVIPENPRIAHCIKVIPFVISTNSELVRYPNPIGPIPGASIPGIASLVCLKFSQTLSQNESFLHNFTSPHIISLNDCHEKADPLILIS